MANQIENGKWILERGEAQWLAWRDWMMHALGWCWFPDKRTAMLSEWPPETPQAAAAVADHWREVNKAIDRDPKNAKLQLRPARKLPIQPMHWVRWSAAECARRVREFHEAEVW